MAAGGFAFGSYQIDVRARRLLRGPDAVSLSSRQFDLLVVFVSHPGEVLTKSELIRAAWGDVSVSDNSLAQAITHLRAALDADNTDGHILTVAGRGYRFVAPVAPVDAELTEAEFDAMVAPHLVFMDGRAALETLELAAVARARQVFEHLLVRHGRKPGIHVGLAMACVLQYESTRANADRDANSLKLALAHAEQARRLEPEYSEAWATLGFVLGRTGAPDEAIAALHRAVELDPDNWRHHLRLAEASWGEDRLSAARRTLALMGECPLASALAATVYVARDALPQAERTIDAGVAAAIADSPARARYSPVALHWLKGLLCLAREDDDAAQASFERELVLEARGQLYARECCANTWYAIGVIRLRRGDRPGARAAFDEAITRVPLHPMAHAGMALAGDAGARDELTAHPGSRSIDVAVARAAMRVASGSIAAAVEDVAAALDETPDANAGWLIPVEPLLGVHRSDARVAWMPVLNRLRTRAG